jgi:hypothetical protein
MRDRHFPLELVASSPALTTADVVEYGATLSLLHAFWMSGGRPLPTEDVGLMLLARCYARRWSAVRERVREALNEIIPALSAAYARESRNAHTRQASARKAGIASAAKRKREAPASVHPVSMLCDGVSMAAPRQPSKATLAPQSFTARGERIPERVSRGIPGGLTDERNPRVVTQFGVSGH